MAIYLPCRKDIDSPELSRLVFEHVLWKHGVPYNIVTDRGKEFTSRFWTPVCSHMSIDHRLSTAFHPQSNGQMEQQNQTFEQYLRAFCNYKQDDWQELLPLAEFAYNNSVHALGQLPYSSYNAVETAKGSNRCTVGDESGRDASWT